MGSMMHMPWVLVMLAVFVLVVGGGVYAAVRVAGARASRPDHPAPGDATTTPRGTQPPQR